MLEGEKRERRDRWRKRKEHLYRKVCVYVCEREREIRPLDGKKRIEGRDLCLATTINGRKKYNQRKEKKQSIEDVFIINLFSGGKLQLRNDLKWNKQDRSQLAFTA